MTKKLKIYQVLTFALSIALVVLLLVMGITAVQKSMKLKIGFEVKPTFLCEIELNGKPIFSNHDENATIANGADLSGNTLTLNETFYVNLGAELTFKIYNYSELKTKVSIENTGKFVVLPAYSNNTASSGSITLDNASGSVELVFEEYVAYTITLSANDGTDTTKTMEVSKGQTATLLRAPFARAGYTFKGWATSSTATEATYSDGASLTPVDDITLYAVWGVVYYTFTANASYNNTYPDTSYYINVVATNDPDFAPTETTFDAGMMPGVEYSYSTNNNFDYKTTTFNNSSTGSITWSLSVEYKIHIFVNTNTGGGGQVIHYIENITSSQEVGFTNSSYYQHCNMIDNNLTITIGAFYENFNIGRN